MLGVKHPEGAVQGLKYERQHWDDFQKIGNFAGLRTRIKGLESRESELAGLRAQEETRFEDKLQAYQDIISALMDDKQRLQSECDSMETTYDGMLRIAGKQTSEAEFPKTKQMHKSLVLHMISTRRDRRVQALRVQLNNQTNLTNMQVEETYKSKAESAELSLALNTLQQTHSTVQIQHEEPLGRVDDQLNSALTGIDMQKAGYDSLVRDHEELTVANTALTEKNNSLEGDIGTAEMKIQLLQSATRPRLVVRLVGWHIQYTP